MTIHKACIIGAGPSGLVAAKTLHERGIPFDCFEMGSGIGGNWRYLNDNGVSAAYQSLRIDTSKERMAFSDFPMPASYPDFPHHSQVLRYFEAYVDHFGFRDTITFRTKVLRVAPNDDGTYNVTTQGPDGSARMATYGAVLVANGHHWDPNWPDFPGTFDGEVLHSHQYKVPDPFAGKRVLVVGIGNSACDIAVEVSHIAWHTVLSTRRGAHIIPKYLLGRPVDTWITDLSSRLPIRVQGALFRVLLYFTRGRLADYGFPEPAHPLPAAHPTVNSDILEHVKQGTIIVKPNVARLAGDRVRFDDGSEASIDTIIYATGYNVTFPFFDEEFLRAEDNALPLYRHVVPPEVPNLYFLGLIQPIGAVMPLVELQAAWVADLLDGTVGLPDRKAMWAAIEQEHARIRKRYLPSKRHTLEVDFYPYRRLLLKERARGRRHSHRRPLPKMTATEAVSV